MTPQTTKRPPKKLTCEVENPIEPKNGSSTTPVPMKTPSKAAKISKIRMKFLLLIDTFNICRKFIFSSCFKATKEGGIFGLSLITRQKRTQIKDAKIFYCHNSVLVAFIVSEVSPSYIP